MINNIDCDALLIIIGLREERGEPGERQRVPVRGDAD